MRIPVTFRAGRHPEREGELVDLSYDGLFIAWGDDTPVPAANTLVKVVARVGDEVHAVEGRVRWVGRHERTGQMGMGLGFDATSAYEAEALAFALAEAPRVSGVFERIR